MDLETEIATWEQYLFQLLNKYPDAKIYLKGGSVLGLECLNQIVKKCNLDNDKFKQLYIDFTKLNLIKDWDFVFQCENYDIKEFYTINPHIKKEGTENRIIMRYQRLTIESDALFELAIQNKISGLAGLELPLTSMCIPITTNNLKNLFMLIKKIYLNMSIDLLYLSHIFQTCIIQIDDCAFAGLFKILPGTSVDEADLSAQMLNLMKPIGDNTIYQFLISQINQPCRFFLRLVEKNINKSEKIKQFFIKYEIILPTWLLDESLVEKIKVIFWTELKLAINAIYDKYSNELEPVHKSVDIINLKIDLLKYNDSLTNMINGLTQGLPNDNLYVMDMLKNYSEEQLRNKIVEFHIKQTKCERYGITKNDILITNKKIRKNTIKKLVKEKTTNGKNIELIYVQLFTDLAELFQGVNISRLTDQINKFTKTTQLELVDFFGYILQHIHLDYLPSVTIKEPYAKIIRLMRILSNIQKIV